MPVQVLKAIGERYQNGDKQERAALAILGVGALALTGVLIAKGIISNEEVTGVAHPVGEIPLDPGEIGPSVGAGGATGAETGGGLSPDVASSQSSALGEYNSHTGAGTVEGNALAQAEAQGVTADDLTPSQAEAFANEVRTQTLERTGWSETEARLRQADQIVHYLRLEELIRIKESVKS